MKVTDIRQPAQKSSSESQVVLMSAAVMDSPFQDYIVQSLRQPYTTETPLYEPCTFLLKFWVQNLGCGLSLEPSVARVVYNLINIHKNT